MVYGKVDMAGSGSTMSSAWYLKKTEQTCIFEDPDQLTNYYRASLKDIRPDRPSLESDQPRTNNYSADRLNLRHYGVRNPTTPDLPDGTFLDFEHLVKDPRGAASGPDMKQYRKQEEARGKFIKFYSDTDNSVPGEGRNQAQVIKDIKGQFYNVKNRMKIFDESLGSMQTSGALHAQRKKTAECMQETDERPREIQDEMCYNKSNKVTDLSNNTSIGWRRTTDHRFKIAKYGQVRSTKTKADQDYTKNRSNTFVEHDVLVSWKGQTVAKSLGLKMIDLSKKRYNDMEAGSNLLLAESQKMQMSRQRKLLPSDIITSKMATNESQDPTANELLKNSQVSHITGRSTKPTLDTKKMEKIIIDPYIIDRMASVNKKMTPREMKDLRDKILQSSEFTGLLLNQSNSKCRAKADINNELLWESTANYDKGVSMKVANYKHLINDQRGKKQGDYDYEDYKTDQKTAIQKLSVLKPSELYNMDVLEYDQKGAHTVDGVKLVGNMGSKRMRSYIDSGDIEYNLNSEVTSLTAR